MRIQAEQCSGRVACTDVAEALGGISPHTLRNWWKQARIDRDKAPGVSTDESEEMRRLRRENLELRRAKEILRKALAFFTAELEELKRIHAENYSIYGVRKKHHAMACTGWQIGRDHVARLMRAAGLQAVRRGHRPITTRPAREPDTRPDVVGRRFAAERPHPLWVADITDVRILAGFCLSRVRHGCIHSPDRWVGRLGQSAYPGAGAAGP